MSYDVPSLIFSSTLVCAAKPSFSLREKEILQELKPIGLVLKPANVSTADYRAQVAQIEALVGEFKTLTKRDQIVVAAEFPFDDPAAALPMLNYLPAPLEWDDPRSLAEVLAHELRALGVNLLFGPPANIARNYATSIVGKRTLGSDADQVTARACLAAQRLLQVRVAPCPFAFPGEGQARQMQGQRFPRVDVSEAEVSFGDMKVFAPLIDIGVPCLQASSVTFSGIDKDLPATLSAAVLGKMLREKLRFSGVIISADLSASAIANMLPTPDIARRALEASCDLRLVSNMEFALDVAIALENVFKLRIVPDSALNQMARRIDDFLQSLAPSTPLPLSDQQRSHFFEICED